MKPAAYPWLKLRARGALVLGRRAVALEHFSLMLRSNPEDAYALASRAHLLWQMHRPDDALVDSRQLVALPGADGRAWFNHGFMLDAAGHLEEARAAFTRAVGLSPHLDRAWYGLGLVLVKLQRLEEAVAALRRNTELQPMSPHGWYQLARVHVDRQEPSEAVKIIRHLLGFEPKVAAQLQRETGLQADGP